MARRKAPTKEESQHLPLYEELAPDCIHIPANPQAFAEAREALMAASTLGFDTESKPVFSTTQTDTGPHVVQLATPTAAWILQLHHPEALSLARDVLAHPHIAKVGFGLDNDKHTLPHRLGLEGLQNIVDLDRIFSRHGFGHNVGVRAGVALVLGQLLHKSKKQSTSNWAKVELSPAQIRYAAQDAHAPAKVHAALVAWEALQPPPPHRVRRAPAAS